MRRRHMLLFIAVLGLLSVALVAFLLYQSPLMTTVVLTAEAEPRAGVPAVGVADPVIDFTAPAYDGTTFSLAALRGKPVLIKFFRGHW